MSAAIKLADKALNGVHRFQPTIKKNGVVWTGIGSVTFLFEKPDRETVVEKPGVLVTPDAGVWYCITDSDDLDTTGFWTLTVSVTDAAVTLTYPYEIGFRVKDNP